MGNQMSSQLAIALILSTATAFSVVVPNHPLLVPTAATATAPQAYNSIQPTQAASSSHGRARTPFLLAASSKSSEGRTRSTKVKDMATFLATQLLEKALAEAMKEDSSKDKKMSMDNLQKLVQVFQSSPSLAAKKQAEDKKLEAAAETLADKESSLLDDDSMEDLVGATAEPTTLDTYEKEAVVEATVLADTAQTATIAAEKENKLAEEKEARVKAEEEDRLKVETKKAEEKEEARLAAEMEKAKQASTIQPAPPPVARSASALPAVIPVRIPGVISKALGRPLEVMLSNVPPLREESIPQKMSKSETTTTETFEKPPSSDARD
jgi:hypothetical protein